MGQLYLFRPSFPAGWAGWTGLMPGLAGWEQTGDFLVYNLINLPRLDGHEGDRP
jgi:hypothetical protein